MNAAKDNHWPSATRAKSCPKCGKPNRCKIAPDGLAGICWRSGSAKPWRDGPAQNRTGNGQHRKPDPTPTKPKPTYTSVEAAIEAAGQFIAGATLVKAWNYPGDVARVARFNLPDGKKEFRPVHRVVNGWAIGDPPGLWPLYRGDEISAVGTVWITEGEKCADLARAIGLAAVASAHGSSAAAKTDWSALAGREVVILADNDTAGENYANEVAAILLALGCKVKIVNLPGLPTGGDIEQFDGQFGGESEATKCAIEEIASNTAWLNSAEIIGGPVVRCLADIESQEISWTWRNRIPAGRITLIVGLPGEGKSFFVLDVAARVSTGSPFPDGSTCERGSVLIISAEDDPGDTIRPRLDALHADVSRVYILQTVRRIDPESKTMREAGFTLADIVSFEETVKRIRPSIVIIDPIGSYLGSKTDAHRDNEVRSILAPVAALAQRYGFAAIIIMHRRKAGGNHADDLALGSRAFTGIARAVWHISRDNANKGRRLLLPGKMNLCAEPTGLAFTIGGEPATIIWEHDPIAMNANDALVQEEGDGPGRPGHERAEAAEWLATELADHEPHKVDELRKAAKDTGLSSWRTVRRAADDLGVIKSKAGFGQAGWTWRLPKPASGHHSGHALLTETFCPLGQNGEIQGETDKIDHSGHNSFIAGNGKNWGGE